MELEPEMLATETIVPIYFAMEDDELLSIYTQTLTSSSSQGSLSAAEGRHLSATGWMFSEELKYIRLWWFVSLVLLHTATANGFQMVTSGAQSKAISDWAITSLEVSDFVHHNLSDSLCLWQITLSHSLRTSFLLSVSAVHFSFSLCADAPVSPQVSSVDSVGCLSGPSCS